MSYQPNDQLIINQFNIREPVYNKNKAIDPRDLTLALLPLVGFNKNKYRLGHGMGYYDNTFAFKLKNPNHMPILVGLAYQFQEISFDPNPWDVPLEMIITDSISRPFLK